ncbi:MAG TPA: 2-amino-4-hydroxy-6-hydroxymethyldihydropteridine diphosphokinase [Candidatus Udaeobacter sp.]|jgi:2-amino-4-hydroxy-6-hydroxymethyldihydropteridine diphosphokinase|nr:2-amino-4-hydroxy-6-hydroxymethyldihydropteridine diphosphokinase [Candidatus Udaeobacter sp.]
MRTAIALGSNLGDGLANLRAARNAILRLPGISPPIISSPVYETDPVDCEPGAQKFLNAVLEFNYEGDPLKLLKSLRDIEYVLGRPRSHRRNISRTIDIDLLYSGERTLDAEELQLPHRRMHTRKFVLQPLADIRPELILPGQTKRVTQLLTEVHESGEVVRFSDAW